jgi:formiminoglutamate deiminase
VSSFFADRALLPDGWADDVSIEIDSGVISTVTEGAVPDQAATRLKGLVLPGLANAHSHAFHRALRSRTHALGGSFWTWRDMMYSAAQRLTPDTYHDLARSVFAEMLESGFTAVGEFHYLHHDVDGTPYSEPNVMAEGLIAAADEVGIRITLLDTVYLHGGLDADGYDPLGPNQIRFGDRSADKYVERSQALVPSSPLATVGTAIHSIRSVDPEAIGIVSEAFDRPVHAHVSEQPDENTQCLAAHGITPIQLLAETGALTPSFTAVHATHLTAHDLELVGTARSSVCFCPTTERDLADGIGPAIELTQAGARLCVGSDSHAVIDPFEEMRAIEMHERLSSHERGVFQAEDLIAAAASNGYESIGWTGGGRIAVGAPADLVCVSLNSTRLAGADPALPADALVFAAGAGDVSDVVVGGRHVVRDGAHASVPVAAELGRTIAALFA